MFKHFLFVGLIPIVAFMFFVTPVCLAETAAIETLYILPFNQGQAPEVVTSALFDALVEHLYEQGEKTGMQVTIVKQELTDADASWFDGKQYLIGEVVRYEEEKGCCYTEINLTGQTQLHLPAGKKQPILEMSDETFFNHDMTSPEAARVKVADRLGKKMAEQLMMQIAAD
jgi:hypothetical protein